MCILCSCEGKGDKAQLETSASQATRKIVPADWDTLGRIRSAARDTLLWAPSQAFLWDSLVIVLEPKQANIAAFTLDGEEVWRVGSRGSGPGEFAMIADGAPTNDSTVAILDFSLSRVTLIDRGGEVRRTVPLDLGAPPTALRSLGRGYIAAKYGRDTTLSILDDEFRLTSSAVIPLSSLSSMAPIARQFRLAANDRGDWAVGFIFGGGVAFQGSGSADYEPYVGAPEFPRTRESGTDDSKITEFADIVMCVACGMGMQGDTIFVLTRDPVERSRHLIDLYLSQPHLHYLYSLILPTKAEYLTVSADGLVVGASDTLGLEILVLRPHVLD